ncbi:MAG: helix-turn-helix transcriptional regulator [Dermatophilaceae bacterium]
MRHELSPTARALRAMEAIQNRPGLTGADLAERLGVTDRAARRYVTILREAGVPVDSMSGPYGGYALGRGAQVPPLMFTTDGA